MINLKKIKVDWIFVGSIITLVLFLVTLITCIVFSFYFFNSINKSEAVIELYVEQVSLIKINTEKANEIINFVPLSTDITIDRSNNPFRIIETKIETE